MDVEFIVCTHVSLARIMLAVGGTLITPAVGGARVTGLRGKALANTAFWSRSVCVPQLSLLAGVCDRKSDAVWVVILTDEELDDSTAGFGSNGGKVAAGRREAGRERRL